MTEKIKHKNEIKSKKKKTGNQTRCHSSFSGGIICGPHPGSFAVQFGDRLRSGIICGAVQYSRTDYPHCFVNAFVVKYYNTRGTD